MSPNPARILLVEDDPEQAMLFSQVLSLSGYEVVSVFDAREAIERLADTTFDLLLVDWDLPGMKGDAFCTLAKEQLPGTKTVLYSNYANVDEGARNCGADAWFRKSDDILRLRKKIAELLLPAA